MMTTPKVDATKLAPSAFASSVAAATTKADRLVFIDALRGLAALAVAAYHIDRYGPLAQPTAKVLPGPLQWAIEHGWIGVQVFFVISGFVIAYSLRTAWVTPRYLGIYALRRSVRLDPPYWATIAVALGLHFLGPALLKIPSPMETPPTWPQIAWHALYLQNVMGYDNLSVGLWTLCIEVQFYLLYAMLQGVAQRFCGEDSWASGGGGRALVVCFAPLALISLVVYRNQGLFAGPAWWWLAPWKSDACVLRFFWMFFLGMLVHWSLAGRTGKWLVPCYLFCLAARFFEPDNAPLNYAAWFTTDRRWPMEVAIASFAGASIFFLGLRGGLATVGKSWPLQFLGRISYSLYLIHYPVSHVIVHLVDNWARRQTWEAPESFRWFAAGWTFAALLASIGVAWLFYLAVERPSLRLAARLRGLA